MITLQYRSAVGAPQRAAARAAPRPQAWRQQRQRLVAALRAAAPTALEGMSVTEFNELVQKASTPAVLIDFCTTWCGPCKVLEQNIKAIKKAHEATVTFHKVDTEKNPDIAGHLGVHKLPTIILFKDGQQVDRYEGLLSGQDLDLRLRARLRD